MNRRYARGMSGAAGLWLTFMVTGGVFPINVTRAETYLAGQIGYTVAQDTTQGSLTDTAIVGLPSGTSTSNLNLNNSLMYGAKLGHYFKSIPWVGVEVESFITTPHVAQQRPRLDIPGVGSTVVQETGSTNRLVVLAPNLVVRYQAGLFEPYIGVGPGVFFLHQRQAALTSGAADYSQSSTRVGLNTQAGLRVRLTEEVSVFGEWKFNYVQFNLPGQIDGAYAGTKAIATLHHFVFGIGYHF